MAWIYNKTTKVITECHNKDIIKICKKDNEGYAVSGNADELKDVVTKKEIEGDKKRLKDMKVEELKAIAKEKGIESDSLTKNELLDLLGE